MTCATVPKTAIDHDDDMFIVKNKVCLNLPGVSEDRLVHRVPNS